MYLANWPEEWELASLGYIEDILPNIDDYPIHIANLSSAVAISRLIRLKRAIPCKMTIETSLFYLYYADTDIA